VNGFASPDPSAAGWPPTAETPRAEADVPAGAEVQTGSSALAPPDLSLRSARFRKGREETWTRLERLVVRLEQKGLSSLTVEEAMELPTLYHSELASLAVARSLILDRNLLEYLENLSLRAYLVVYGPRTSLWECLAAFFKTGLPASVRALKWHILATGLLAAFSVLVAFVAVRADPNLFAVFVTDLDDRTYAASAQDLLDGLFLDWRGVKYSFLHFANFLYRNNTMVALNCFGLGFLLGVPTITLIIQNFLILGAFLALYFDKGLFIEFVGWLSIHGVTELSAIVLSGAAGLSIAQAIVVPGESSRLENLRRHGRHAATVMVGVVLMLLAAGILEGCFRQLFSFTILRYLVAIGTAIFWTRYFLSGRQKTNEEADATSAQADASDRQNP
jgi:uncharacterized membrane protein SpoIIM required for sporulation